VKAAVNPVQEDVLDQQDGQALLPQRQTPDRPELRWAAAQQQGHRRRQQEQAASGQEQRHQEPVQNIGAHCAPVFPPVHAGVAGHQPSQDGKRDRQARQPAQRTQ
jgi:hypothetical protein